MVEPVKRVFTREAFRRILPRVVIAVKPAFQRLAPTVKKTAVAAAATAAGYAASTLSDDPDRAMGQVLDDLSTKDVGVNVDAIGALMASIPAEERARLLNELSTSADSAAVAEAVAVAAARYSATMATGDHAATSFAAAMGYDEMMAHIRVIKRAMAAIGVGDPAALRALRDAMFIDEQAFNAALERI